MKKKSGGQEPASPRKRKAVNLTLSDEVREGGKALAEKRGIKLAQLVEQTIRAELRKAGILPPEGA